MKTLLLLTVFALFTKFVAAQTIGDIISNSNLNFYEMQAQIEVNKALLYDNAPKKIQKRYDRWLTFWSTRVDASGNFEAYGNHLIEYNENYSKSAVTPKYWESLGPTEDLLQTTWKHIGCIESVWANPNNIDEIYIGSNSSGLFKTTDGGIHWRLLTAEYAFGVQDIEVDMINGIMYIATGIYANGLLSYGGYGTGIYKSTDWGETWEALQNISPEDMQYMRRIVISQNSSELFVVSRNKVYKSIDSGDTWSIILEAGVD